MRVEVTSYREGIETDRQMEREREKERRKERKEERDRGEELNCVYKINLFQPSGAADHTCTSTAVAYYIGAVTLFPMNEQRQMLHYK